jgi:hypothetical protein
MMIPTRTRTAEDPRMPLRWTACTLLTIAGLTVAAGARADDDVAGAEQAIVRLHESGKLYNTNQYKTAVRPAFARLFEAKHRDDIRAAWSDDADELNKWLDAHRDLKEDFYTAIDEEHDQIVPALRLFRDLWKKYPDQLAKHPDLGIAVAVTWDDPRGVYDYRQHQTRTHSTMPGDLVDGPGNFEYLVENEKVTEGRCRYLPWEYLIFVIDHQTPLAERKWAQKYYKSHARASSWHQDVPYDFDMLRAEREKDGGHPKLEGHGYTLANIRKYGGVCAMQADFAARVAKSVGSPAVYFWGKSAFRGWHAWWMFVQIQRATPDKLQFNLTSDGRFAGFIKDAFYTGYVTDPHTGQHILDRDMERRLWTVGHDRVGKRHVDLLMRAYPWLHERLHWSPLQRAKFLDRCIAISPRSDVPWLELGQLVAKAGWPTALLADISRRHMEQFFTEFRTYPDLITQLLPDLLHPVPAEDQVGYYRRAVTLCERAGRPDLSCETRLRITDVLAFEKKWKDAAGGLLSTIKRFPTEGRYVPQMTQRMQEVCDHYKGGPERLGALYLELVPKLVSYYRSEGSEYPKQLYDQAMDFFTKHNMDRYSVQLQARAGKLGG